MEDNILQFKKIEAQLPIKETKGYCNHKNVEVDTEERDLRCRTCNARIDQFKYVYDLALEERNFFYHLSDLRKKQKVEHEKLLELERQVRNLKAQKNRLSNQ